MKHTPSYAFQVTNASSNTNAVDSNINPKNTNIFSKNCLKSFLGLFYCILGSVCFNLSAVIVKKLAYISPEELSNIRNLGMLTFTLPFISYKIDDKTLSLKDKFLLVLRGFAAATALYLYYISFQYIPLVIVMTTRASMPFFTMVIARICIKEKCGILQIISMLLTVGGIFLSIGLPKLFTTENKIVFTKEYIQGILATLLGVILFSSNCVLGRYMKYVSVNLVTLYVSFVGFIEGIIIQFYRSSFTTMTCGLDAAYCIILTFVTFMGFIFLNLSFQSQPAGIVTVVKCGIDIIMGILLGLIFFGAIPDVYNISGAILVIFALSLIGLRNWALMSAEQLDSRHWLQYLLK